MSEMPLYGFPASLPFSKLYLRVKRACFLYLCFSLAIAPAER